jgi:hypothetical protein
LPTTAAPVTTSHVLAVGLLFFITASIVMTPSEPPSDPLRAMLLNVEMEQDKKRAEHEQVQSSRKSDLRYPVACLEIAVAAADFHQLVLWSMDNFCS